MSDKKLSPHVKALRKFHAEQRKREIRLDMGDEAVEDAQEKVALAMSGHPALERPWYKKLLAKVRR